MKTKLSRYFGLSLVMATLSYSVAAGAWADLGHEVVGGVAEQLINPQTKDFVRGILGVEPLAVAAVFPDHVRDDQRFGHRESDYTKRDGDDHDFGDYHFCEVPTGFDYDSKPNKDVKDCYGAIQGSITLLEDTSGHVTRAEKMIALRYLAHLMGDITQPLHVGNGYDMGANVCQIKVQEDPQATPVRMNLHAFWDDNLVNFLGTTYADPATKTKAAKYLSDYLPAMQKHRPEMFTADAKAKYGQGDVKSWIMEAAALRESGVYPDAPGSMNGVTKGQEYKNRPYCLWFSDVKAGVLGTGSVIDQTKIPVLGLDYEKQFAPIVETQLLKGGLRLAAMLDQIAQVASAGARPAKALTDDQQEKVITGVQGKFRNLGTP